MPASMLMPVDDWMVMLHGRVNGIADWQSGPHAANDQVFSTSMFDGNGDQATWTTATPLD